MKRLKKILPIAIVAAVLIAVDLSTGYISIFFKYLPYQFSSEKYIEFVEKTYCEENLEEDHLCVNDKNYDGTELFKTQLPEITEKHSLHNKLEEEYSLSQIASAENDFDKALQVLSWLTENTFYSGIRFRFLNDNTEDMLNSSFGKPFLKALNCRNKAIIFSDCLVAAGVKAYPICMISMNGSCHFTCHVYISETDKWCLFDPSFGCWLSDEKGQPLDVFEVRDMFLQGGKPVAQNYSFNGTDRAEEEYMNAFLKQCLSNLSTWKDNSHKDRDKMLAKSFNYAIPE